MYISARCMSDITFIFFDEVVTYLYVFSAWEWSPVRASASAFFMRVRFMTY